MEFSSYWQHAKPTLWRHALRLAKLREDAEDLLSETSLRLLTSFAGYDRSKPFQNWALRAMTRLWLDELRDRARRPVTVNLDEAAAIKVDSLPNLGVRQMVENLTAEGREVVQKRAEGYTAREIAAQIGIPPAQVHRRLAAVRESATRRYQ